MSAHRTLNDLYRAFSDIGPGILEDPGDAGTITVTQQFQICELTTAAAETRTLARPNRSGIRFILRMYTDGGDAVVTVTGGMNPGLDTVATFADAGDLLSFVSVRASATTFRWEILEGNIGSTAITSSTPSHTPSHTSSPSHTVSPSAT